MTITLKPETEQDSRIVNELTRDAFRDLYKPGADEHFILHKMRKVAAFVKELDILAREDTTIVGNIAYTKAQIRNEQGQAFEVLCMGPVSVLPSHQKKWIGSLLINYTVQKAKELWYKAIILFWNPDFYHRFGFVNTEKYNIQTSSGDNFDAFMVLELYEGALQNISWKFYEDKVFEVDPDQLADFEKQFPPREKHITDTQLKI